MKQFIATFDILGFSQRLQSEDVVTISNKMESFYSQSIKSALTDCNTLVSAKGKELEDQFNFYSFSDSTVMTFKPVTSIPGALCVFIRAIITFISISIDHDFQVRGAISYGEFVADEKMKFFLGRGLVEAHEWGEFQEWMGAVLTPSCESIWDEAVRNDEKNDVCVSATHANAVLDYPVPTKNGSCFLKAINWPYAYKHAKMKWKPSPHPKYFIKYRNTELFFEHCKKINEPYKQLHGIK